MAGKKRAATHTVLTQDNSWPPRQVTPDGVDFRDRIYAPSVQRPPVAELIPPAKPVCPVLDQKDSEACTGFALATVMHRLLMHRDDRLSAEVSPFMLYGMARCYDNLPGEEASNGSTCRGALKGWFKHGACALELWQTLTEPMAADGSSLMSWWDDAVQRPLGAYYRVDPRSIVDMQAALNEVGVLFASAAIHSGWKAGFDQKTASRRSKSLWSIDFQDNPTEGGHAFAIVGYTVHGFIIQNSWGTTWGSKGLAVLSYRDWLTNGYDCWVAQLGVVTDLHLQAAQGGVTHPSMNSASAGMLDVHALAPYIINTENNGKLSMSGEFHTRKEDVDALASSLIPAHRAAWGIPVGQPLDVALYAHGGLVNERAAAETASTWIPLLKNAKVFPIFFMWESGLLETLLDEIKDYFSKGGAVPTGGFLAGLDRWWSDRVEGVGRLIGKPRWNEMKENAEQLSSRTDGGARLLVNSLKPLQGQIRLHLIGHSAGAVVHAHLAELLVGQGWQIESLSLMAPAARIDLFRQKLVPLLKAGSIRRVAQLHLVDACESDEGSMRIAFGYRRSLLYMISNGLEENRNVPILGMQKFFERDVLPLQLPNLRHFSSPGGITQATQHGAFDDDPSTQGSVIRHVLGQL